MARTAFWLLAALLCGRDTQAGLVIESVRGEPLQPKLEQARLERSEASVRLEELESLEARLSQELAEIEGRIDRHRNELETARTLLERWQDSGPGDVEALEQARLKAEQLRRALAGPLADLTLARSQDGQSSKVFRLEALVQAILDELQSLEQQISRSTDRLASSEDAADKAREELSRLQPVLRESRAERGIVSADLEQVRADIASWREITETRTDEFTKIERIIAALAAEEGLVLEPPAVIAALPPLRASSRAWPVPNPGFGTEPALAVMPVDGQIVSQFGEAQTAPLDRGIFIQAAPGSRIVAPRAGTVVFAGPFQRYGQLLIIDHGDGYHTLLSGFDWLGVSEQTAVEAGQLVGSLASDRQGNSRLYLELRRRGKPSNPLPWLAAREDRIRG